MFTNDIYHSYEKKNCAKGILILINEGPRNVMRAK